MKCLLCDNFSLTHICYKCQDNFLKPQIYTRNVDNIQVISFYKYKDIKELIHTKHTDLGYYIYNILAKNSFDKFSKEFKHTSTINSVAIDDHTKSGYSHTAILNKHLNSKYIKPLCNKLIAKNDVNYSGKTKQFRLQNPRDFYLKDAGFKEVIVVDDIITTGFTLKQAIDTINKSGADVLFCLTLADSSTSMIN